jgi:hypothetical protein
LVLIRVDPRSSVANTSARLNKTSHQDYQPRINADQRGSETEFKTESDPQVMAMKTYRFKVVVETDEDFDRHPAG